VYLYTKPDTSGTTLKADEWYFTAVDFQTGATVYRVLMGEGLLYNDNGAPITLGPDGGIAYSGCLGGLLSIRDNRTPNQPANVLPGNGATGVSLAPTLQSSSFSDPDAGDAHVASQWQVSATAGDYTSPVFDSGTDASRLTSMTTPSATLGCSTTYHWHVRYQDPGGAWSLYSSETSFTTIAGQVETATHTGTATLSLSSGTIQNLTAVADTSPPPEGKPELIFPHGLFEFRIPGLTNGQSITLTITLPSAVPTTASYWKYGPTSTAPLGEWYQIPMGDNDGDNVITITLTDGGWGDDDRSPNGTIVDQGGPGWPGPSGGGGGHSAPVFPSIYIGIGAALGAGIVAYAVRRRLAAR